MEDGAILFGRERQSLQSWALKEDMADLLNIVTGKGKELVERYTEMVNNHWYRFMVYKLSDDFKELQLVVPEGMSTTAELAIEGYKRSGDKQSTQHAVEQHDDHFGLLGILPNEILLLMVHYFDAKSLCAMSCVSKYWLNLCRDVKIWEGLVQRELADNNICGWHKKWEDLVAQLPPNQPRYAIFMWQKPEKEGIPIIGGAYTPLFVFWCPDTCSVKTKMVYSSTKISVKKAVMGSGVRVEAQATDPTELAYEVIEDLMARMF